MWTLFWQYEFLSVKNQVKSEFFSEKDVPKMHDRRSFFPPVIPYNYDSYSDIYPLYHYIILKRYDALWEFPTLLYVFCCHFVKLLNARHRGRRHKGTEACKHKAQWK